jgi:hypothetical protein
VVADRFFLGLGAGLHETSEVAVIARFLIPIFVLAFSASLTLAADLPRASLVKAPQATDSPAVAN